MVLELMRRVRQQGLSVILVSHNVPQVFAVDDRIHVARAAAGGTAGLSSRNPSLHRPGRHKAWGSMDSSQNMLAVTGFCSMGVARIELA